MANSNQNNRGNLVVKTKKNNFVTIIDGVKYTIPVEVTVRNRPIKTKDFIALVKVNYGGVVVNDIRIAKATDVENKRSNFNIVIEYPKKTIDSKKSYDYLVAYPSNKELSVFLNNLIYSCYSDWQVEINNKRVENSVKNAEKQNVINNG